MLALEQPCLIRGFPVKIGASVGVSLFPQNGKDVDELMQRADVAMYAAKHDGTGIREYDAGRDRQSGGRLSLLSELSVAIETDQLRLEFQPKVHLSTGRCEGVEALVRWEHPVLGTIRPDQFVPLAEHTELMEPMTDWIIATALEHRRQWADAGVALRVAVNASAQNLHDLRFAQRVASRMLAAGADPKWLELEITENAVMTDPVRVLHVLGAIHEMGIDVSIDDFGTGYSSLASLRNLPVSAVKIDRSFVSAMLSSESDRAIVHSIIELASNLGLETVAEGIESAAVHYVLRDMGCRSGQGFLYSPPVSHRDVAALARRGFSSANWLESTAAVRP